MHSKILLEINCKLYKIHTNRHTTAFQCRKKTTVTLHQSCFDVEIKPYVIYSLSYVQGLYIMNGHLLYLRKDKIYVRTTWHDLFVLAQHEGSNWIHTIFGKSIMFLCLMVFSATFNTISVISWPSVLLVAGVLGENLSQVTDKIYHIMLYTSSWLRFEFTTSVLISTHCIGSCKSNYHGHDRPQVCYVTLCRNLK